MLNFNGFDETFETDCQMSARNTCMCDSGVILKIWCHHTLNAITPHLFNNNGIEGQMKGHEKETNMRETETQNVLSHTFYHIESAVGKKAYSISHI